MKGCAKLNQWEFSVAGRTGNFKWIQYMQCGQSYFLHLSPFSLAVFTLVPDLSFEYWLSLVIAKENNCFAVYQMINSKFFLLCFKMMENSENFDKMLHDWAKIRYKKALSRHWTITRNRNKYIRRSCFIRKWLGKTLEQS